MCVKSLIDRTGPNQSAWRIIALHRETTFCKRIRTSLYRSSLSGEGCIRLMTVKTLGLQSEQFTPHLKCKVCLNLLKTVFHFSLKCFFIYLFGRNPLKINTRLFIVFISKIWHWKLWMHDRHVVMCCVVQSGLCNTTPSGPFIRCCSAHLIQWYMRYFIPVLLE